MNMKLICFHFQRCRLPYKVYIALYIVVISKCDSHNTACLTRLVIIPTFPLTWFTDKVEGYEVR